MVGVVFLGVFVVGVLLLVFRGWGFVCGACTFSHGPDGFCCSGLLVGFCCWGVVVEVLLLGLCCRGCDGARTFTAVAPKRRMIAGPSCVASSHSEAGAPAAQPKVRNGWSGVTCGEGELGVNRNGWSVVTVIECE